MKANAAPITAFSLRGLAGVHLDDVAGLLLGQVHRARVLLAGRHRLGDVHHLAVLVEPDDVDRELAVLHPDAVEVGALEDEEQGAVAGSEGRNIRPICRSSSSTMSSVW